MAAPHCPLKDCKFIESVFPMKLHHLKEIEHHIASSDCSHPPLKCVIFEPHPDTFITPIQLACQHGELDSVKHLVETWGVDVQASFKYYSISSRRYVPKIGEATPLFVAAFHGHDKIVRYLLNKGADVSAKTICRSFWQEGFTPLYGAVYYWYYDSKRSLLQQQKERSDVVRSLLEFGADPTADSFNQSTGKPMWMQRMCGVDVTTILINHGLDLKQYNRRTGETLLHYWAGFPRNFTEKDSLAIVKLLVDKGAHLVTCDSKGFTPLQTAAHDSNLKILDYLLSRDEYGRTEKMIAMELSGAAILFDGANAPHSPKAFEYWRRAHQLRQMGIDVNGPSCEKNLGRKIGSHVEWTTLADLDQLEQHPEDYQIQAILVKLRILSSFPGNSHHTLSTWCINYLPESTSLEEDEKFTQILDVRWGMLDKVIHHLHPDFTDDVCVWVLIADDIDKLFSILHTLREKNSILFNFETIKTTLDLIFRATYSSPITITNGEHASNQSFMRLMGTEFSQRLLILIETMVHLPETQNELNKASLAQSLRFLGPHQLGNLLLQSCKKLSNFESLAVNRVLLEAGANPNVAVDELHGNASLHIVATLTNRQLGDKAGHLLVGFGAKLHQVNKAEKTALDIWIELNEAEDDLVEEDDKWSARPEWCLPVPTLLSLAARVIRVHKIPYNDGKTPASLRPLIELR